jgi:hypothetical protein
VVEEAFLAGDEPLWTDPLEPKGPIEVEEGLLPSAGSIAPTSHFATGGEAG